MDIENKSHEEIAKEIIGKWGYEEEYWWKPIKEALDRARAEENEKCKGCHLCSQIRENKTD